MPLGTIASESFDPVEALVYQGLCQKVGHDCLLLAFRPNQAAAR